MIMYKRHSAVRVLALVAKWRILVEKVQPLHLPSSLLSCYREDEEGDAIDACGQGSGS